MTLDLGEISNSKLRIAKLRIFAKLCRHIRIRIGIFAKLRIDIRIRICIFAKLRQKSHPNCVPENSIRTRLVTIKYTSPPSSQSSASLRLIELRIEAWQQAAILSDTGGNVNDVNDATGARVFQNKLINCLVAPTNFTTHPGPEVRPQCVMWLLADLNCVN